jgi:hypothetical protein
MAVRSLSLWLLLAAAPVLSRAQPSSPAGEILLSARRNDATSCRIADAAAVDLRRTPLSHAVRVVRFGGGEAWKPVEAERVLAHLNLETPGGRGSGGPVIRAGSGRLAPGWLVHAVLRSGDAVGRPYAVEAPRFSLLAQLLARSVKARHGSAGEPFVDAGVPSVTLSGSSPQAVAAAVRRLDSLAGRPLPEDQYLVFAGRVWVRRDLIWMGFLLWGLLVFRGRPGRWRGTPAAERDRQMRTYLPGFLFRLFLLAAVLLAPVFAVLLFPAAILALLPPRPAWARAVWIILGMLPLLAYLITLGIASAQGTALLDAGFQGGMAAATLVPSALVAYGLGIARRQLTVHDTSGKVES